MMINCKEKNGFTLIEIIVVFVIFMILASLLLGAINRARKKAHQAKCISNLKNIGEAIHTYSIDWDERFPVSASGLGKDSLSILYTSEYINNEGLFICPQGNGTSALDSDYRYTPGLSESARAESALACDDQADHHLQPSNVNVLYVRGNVKMESVIPKGPIE